MFFNRTRINIILDAFSYLVTDKRCEIYGFVIMSNHYHFIWQILEPHTLQQVQHSLLSFTSKALLKTLSDAERYFYKVNETDRAHRIYESMVWAWEIQFPKTFWQKLKYIHYNPVKADIVEFPDEYKYSSARSYKTGEQEYNFLSFAYREQYGN